MPEEYKEGVARVSNIVDSSFPFKGTPAYWNFIKWLKKEQISHDEYMGTANWWGTMIHESLERYIKGEVLLKFPVPFMIMGHILHWKNRLDNLSPDEIQTEVYILEQNERFQWTVDLLYKKEWKTILRDWKSFGVAKLKYGLNPGKPAVDKKKREKVQLQMSLYAYAMKQKGQTIDFLELLYIHKDKLRVYEMPILNDSEIEQAINKWKMENIGEDIKDLLF